MPQQRSFPASGARLRASGMVLLGMLLATPLVALAGCGQPGGQSAAGPTRSARPLPSASATASPAGGAAASAAAAARAAALAKAVAVTNSMSLPQKVGQLLVPTVPGDTAAAGGAALVKRYHVGGVIYFANNIVSPSQVAALSDGLQQAALSQRPHLPLLIGTDQEGGIVARLTGLSTQFPNQMAAGATRDPSLIRAQERVTARQMRAMGINLDYAPVADVNVDPANPVIGVRSFGANPALVSSMTAAAVAGFHEGGIAATAKHFPGHGDTNVDSHTGLPIIHHTLAQWWRIDAPPFQAAIAAGVDEIMIAHIEVPALDRSGRPASLSPTIVTGYLRGKLGYQGVVTTDSLQMAGVLQGHTDATVAVDAVLAGCDQLLMPGSVPVAYHAVMAAVRDGRISMARLDASVTRIVTLKIERGLLRQPLVAAAQAGARQNSATDRAIAQRLADRSITLVKNAVAAGTRRVLPLSGQSVYLADPMGTGLAGPLSAGLARTGGQLVGTPGAATVIVVATQDATGDPTQQALVAQLAATGKPVVVVATGVPYDLGLFPHVAAELASYSSAVVSLNAVAGVLVGEVNPSGVLPVSIPRPDGRIIYRYGAGLHY